MTRFDRESPRDPALFSLDLGDQALVRHNTRGLFLQPGDGGSPKRASESKLVCRKWV